MSLEANNPQAKTYSKIKYRLFFVNALLSGLFLISVLVTGLSSWLVQNLTNWQISPWLVVGAYAVIGYTFMDLVFLPLSFYSGYILEHRFQLSNMTFGAWFWDHIKGFLISIIFSVIALEVLYLFLGYFPKTWWIWTFCTWLFFSFVLGKLAPILLLPIFYKIEPLENPSLKERLIILATAVNAKILGVYKMNMSKKTKKANAMFAGIGSTKRIILGDTLLDNFTEDEIEVILAHEMGHYYYKHIIMQLAFSSVLFLTGLLLVDKIIEYLLPVFGFATIQDVAAFPLFSLILSIFFSMAMPGVNGFSRACERAADRFALVRTKNKSAFISSMEKLAKQNLADPCPPRWIEWLLYSHPSIQRRIEMAHKF